MPVVRTLGRLISLGLCLVAMSCASSGSSRTGGGYAPPRMLSRSTSPELRMPTTPGSVRIDIEVEVDESGRADVSTLQVTGAGASDNRHAIQQWLQQASFAPARRGGVPVRGIFEMRIEAGVGVRRVRGPGRG